MPDAFNLTVLKPYDFQVLAGSEAVANSRFLVATDQPGERWVTPANGYLRIDLFSVRRITQVAVLYTDALRTPFTGAAAGDYVSVAYSNDPNFGDGQYTYLPALAVADEAMMDYAPVGYRHFLFNVPAGFNARYLQINFSCPTGQVRSVGRVAVGEAMQVEYNPDYGDTSWGFEEAPEPDTLDSGVTILEELPAAPYFEFGISWASESEMERGWNATLGPLQWYRKPVLVTRRPDPHQYRHTGIFWGVLRLQPFVAAQFDMFEVKGKIRSMM